MDYEWIRRLWANDGLVTLLVASLYVIGVVIVRWRLIARPYRQELQAQADILCARVEILNAPDEQKDRIKDLLGPITSATPSATDKWLWGQGFETAATRRLNEAHLLIVDLLPEDYLPGSLAVAQSDLQEVPTKRAADLAGQVRSNLERLADDSAKDPSSPTLRVLLRKSVEVARERPLANFLEVMTFHRKLLWIIITGILLAVSLATFLGNAQFLLLGAVGAFLSRLYIAIKAEDVPRHYGVYWTTLMLGPIVGALAAYAGLLVLQMLNDLNILGAAFTSIQWSKPSSPGALAIAFLLGFSTRFLERFVAQAESRLPGGAAQPSVPPGVASPAAEPARAR
jgi:hypothetical protein